MSVIAAEGDWYFIHPVEGNDEKTNILHVVAWSCEDDGRVIGMVGNIESKTDGMYDKLVCHPPIDGVYIKRNPINTAQIDAAIEGKAISYKELSDLSADSKHEIS
ncbi:MAG: hypothetical protein ACI9WC_001508 [Arenicella sp.]|jgi:hypothetical protein